jgi:arabinogalactan endo-1,4-beta-galactosidase
MLPEYPASPDGQFQFLTDLKELIQEVNGGNGLCYWAPEWIAWKGAQATEGSPWENQALFDFDSKALPALSVFNTD